MHAFICYSILLFSTILFDSGGVLIAFVSCFLIPHFSSNSLPVKNCFRVSTTGRTKSQSHSLQANDSFNKQQWISCLRQAMVQSRDRQAQTSHCKPSERLSPDPALYNNIAELNLNSDVEMPDT